jgi:hypothetical protein
MSFGTSVGDIILIVQLAWNTVQGAKQACGEHDELTREVASLHKVLNRVRREISRSSSSRENDQRKKELDEHVAGCEHVLRVMNEVLVKYNALGEDKKKGRGLERLWKKIKFANGEKSDLADIRSKLTTHTSALMMSLKLYTLGSLGRVEEQLGNQGGELKGIKESINWIAANMTASKSAAGEMSVWTTYENDDRAFWRELRRELHSDGFPRSALEKRKSLIKAYVKELGNRGVFDEDEDEDEGTNFETRDIGGDQGKGKQRLEAIQDDEDVEDDSEDSKSSKDRGKFVPEKQEPLRPATEKRKSLVDDFEEEIGTREASDEDGSAGIESTECDDNQIPGHRERIIFEESQFMSSGSNANRDREDFREAEKSRQTPRKPHRNRKKGKQQAATMVDNEEVEDDLGDFKKSKGEERRGFTDYNYNRVECPRCGRSFSRNFNLPFNRQFDLPLHLQAHEDFDNIHPFHCRGVCSKTFVSLEDRDIHELVHSGEKNFVCETFESDGTRNGCGRQFARSDCLLAHLRSNSGKLCLIEMGLDDWKIQKRHGETDEEGEDDSDSGNSKNVEVSQNSESELELPDEQSSDIYSESSSSSSDSESDSEPLSKSTPNPLNSQTSKVDSKPKAPLTTRQLLEIATKQADEVRIAEHEKAIEKAVKEGDEVRAAISRRSIDLIKNGKQSQ